MTDLLRARSRQLHVAEYFGPTVQGEGPSTGQQALFVRLSRCNLSCRWCDTPYTWDWSRFDPRTESRKLPVAELVSWATAVPVELVVVTGGEPLIQQQSLVELVAALTGAGKRVEIETNGTIIPDEALTASVSRFNVSPKLSNSGDPENRRLVPDALRAFAATGKAVFKFVACTPADCDEIAALEAEYRLTPVWVMPEGTTPETVLTGMRWLAEIALARGWHLSSRLHVLLWGDCRGR